MIYKLLDEIMVEIHKLWPECKMVRGSPWCSSTNGGIERFKRTIEQKTKAWVKDTNSSHWSIDCYIICWRYNTQVHHALGNKMSYQVHYGQVPRVGISNLPISPALLDTSHNNGTEDYFKSPNQPVYIKCGVMNEDEKEYCTKKFIVSCKK